MMNKKSILGLTLFTFAVIAGLFFGTMFMIGQPTDLNYYPNQQPDVNEDDIEDSPVENSNEDGHLNQDISSDEIGKDELTYADAANGDNGEDKQDQKPQSEASNNLPSDTEVSSEDGQKQPEDLEAAETGNTEENAGGENSTDTNSDTSLDAISQDDSEEALGEKIIELPDMQLITDCTQVDYMKYIPEMIYDSKIEVALDIVNPSLDIRAK